MKFIWKKIKSASKKISKIRPSLISADIIYDKRRMNKCRRLDQNLKQRPVFINNSKKFINQNSKIFTIGSCFAIEISEYLINKNYNVLTNSDDFTKYKLRWYNTYSILYEFERASGRFKRHRNDVLVLHNGRYRDPYRGRMTASTYVEFMERTNRLDSVIKSGIINADVIIMTLGLTEVWVRRDNGKVICEYPRKEDNLDCIFKTSTYDENLNNVRKALIQLKEINENCIVILTVSPVALARTFRDIDHLIANTESKSILRSVCGQIEREYNNVIYYPIYEMATFYDRDQVFKEDGRHVEREFVSNMMKHFEKHFVG